MSSGSGAIAQGRTRRDLVGGLAIGGAAYAIAGPLRVANAAPTEQECVPTGPGVRTSAIAVAPGGRTLWTADNGSTTITQYRTRDLRRRRSIDVGGAPLAIALSPDGELALVTTASYDRPGLAIVHLATRAVDRVDVGPEPGAVAFAPNGRRAYVLTGAGEGELVRVDPRTGRVRATIALGANPRGLAIFPSGRRALVALNTDGVVAVVDLVRGRVVRRIATPAFPAQIAIAPGGGRALVTHDGYAARRVTPIDLRRLRAGRAIRVGLDPAGVAFTRSGAGAVVTGSGNGTVALLDARAARRRRTVRVLGAPRPVAIAGSRAIVADGLSGRLTAVRLGTLR